MKIELSVLGYALMSFFLLGCDPGSSNEIEIDGLREPVEIIVDKWGIPHIYAENEYDLFFAQGYNAARDRLFQLEVWRRQATGTVAEILGESELRRDIGTRLFKFRGDMTNELNHYHDNGGQIINAFVDGVNAYIDITRQNPEALPQEFGILGIEPGHWTPEVVISRHQGLLGNIRQELNIGRAVAVAGPETVRDLTYFVRDPNLNLDPSITEEMLSKDILGLYSAFRRKVTFSSSDESLAWDGDFSENPDVGSNNWIVSGDITKSGKPMMANDPHRTQAVPSLRYWVHLSAPGWNVIGGGEPEIPGVSIGHNGYGAWGLTVFYTDAEDLYVYDINPENLNQYKYEENWEDMKVIAEQIPVKGQDNYEAKLRYTRHGPVTFIDSVLHKAYAVRCGWLEIGGSPYLASLRMDQASSWEEFRTACNFSNIPGENMIWADKDGTIGWQAVGIAPVRQNWSGLVPVPGDGTYEWEGYLPIIDKPNVTNPNSGYFETANEYVVPDHYEYMDAIGYSWAEPFRGTRINSVLEGRTNLTMDDMMDLQTDVYSMPASQLVPLLSAIPFKDSTEVAAQDLVASWDFRLEGESTAAGIYISWERALQRKMAELMIPTNLNQHLRGVPMIRIIEWLTMPDEASLGASPVATRDQILKDTFSEAVELMIKDFGTDMSGWNYGQETYKHITLTHALDELLSEEERSTFNVGPAPRRGNNYTVNSTGRGNNQNHGASFRIIVDLSDFENSVGANSPGQSGDPRSHHYKDLFDSWSRDEYFPVVYSRGRVEENEDFRIRLTPKSN